MLADGERSHIKRVPIDIERAAVQHTAYEAALERLGCEIVRVPAAPDLPDAVFVEDTAVVVDEVAVICRPGAASRRPEIDAVAKALAEFRTLRPIEAPATVDGGDVLRIRDDVFVGRSDRTNDAGVAAIRSILEPRGLAVRAVPVAGCLHLKSAVTAVAEDTLLLNPRWVDPARFEGYHLLEVDPAEPFAANALRVEGTVLMAAGAPRTAERVARAGVAVTAVDISELVKAEAGVSCGSIVLETDQSPSVSM